MGRDGVAPPESEDTWFTVKPATIYGITTRVGGLDSTVLGLPPVAQAFPRKQKPQKQIFVLQPNQRVYD